MKKFQNISATIANNIKYLFVGKAYDQMVFANQLPIAVKAFVHNHFIDQSISFVSRNANATGYILTFNNGSEISIDQSGSWSKVAFMLNSAPISLLPQNMTAYMNSKFPGNSIVEIERTFDNYKTLFPFHNVMMFDKEGHPTVS